MSEPNNARVTQHQERAKPCESNPLSGAAKDHESNQET
jgi:hypothetical protein